MANKYRYQSKTETTIKKYFSLSIIILMSVVTMYFANYLIKNAQKLEAGAAAGTADLFFEPNSLSLTPTGSTNVWITTDRPLGFVRAELKFDPAVVKLTQEVALTNPALKRIVKVTTMAEANKSGVVSIILGVDPTTLSTAPTGSFKIATLSLASVVTTTNLNSSITFNSANLQLVDTSAIIFTPTNTAASLLINPVASPSPTTAPTPTPTPVTIPNTSSDSVIPTVSITTPQNGASISGNTKVSIAANASDNIGVTQVQFLVNNIVQCTDTVAPYTCDWQTAKGRKTYEIKVVATDAAGNTGYQTISVSSK